MNDNLIIKIKKKDIEITCTRKKYFKIKKYKIQKIKYTNLNDIKQFFKKETSMIKWKNIKLILNSHKYTILPTKLVMNNSMIYELLNISCSIKKNDHIVKNNLQNTGITLAFGVEKALIECISDLFFPQKINIFHFDYLILESIINDLKILNKNETNFLVYIEEEEIHISIIQKSKIIYHNKFEYKEIEKAVYYILIIKDILQLQMLNKVIVWGEVNNNHNIIENLSLYFKNILIRKIKI